MLAPPFMDHQMTSNPRVCMGSNTAAPAMDSGRCSRAEVFLPQDTVHSRRGRGLLPQDTQCLTHPEWYHTLFVYLFSKHLTDIAKGPPSTTIGGCRASQEGFGGGYLCQTLRTMPKRSEVASCPILPLKCANSY